MKTKHEYEKTDTDRNESGIILIAVACFSALAAILAIGLVAESSTQMKIAGKNVSLEQAFFTAEAGAERAVAHIRNGGAVPTNLCGTIGKGSYRAQILSTPNTTGTGGTHTVSGQININPNNAPNREFLLMTTDGQAIDREDLMNSAMQDFSGNAYLIRVMPKGNSDQTITVDNSTFTMDRNTAYNFTAASIPVVLTNDSRGTNGLAMGQWWINIDGSGISMGDDPDTSGGQIALFSIYSIGSIENVKRTVLLDGVHQESWARYAMWYNSGPGAIWIKSGEVFNGPVHANTYIYLQGDPIFNALVSSTMSSWGSGSSTGSVTFNQGYMLNASSQTMASVNFSNLLSKADVVVTGTTSITLSGTNMLITNPRYGWTTNRVTIPSNCLIYAVDGSGGASGTRPGTISVGGNLDGQLTIVADTDIKVTNHLTYAVHPTNNSDDALGLVARRDVIVTTETPANLNLFAHVMAVGSATTASDDGSFEVQNHNSRAAAGSLNVYGGIVQNYRGYVGTFSGSTLLSGYNKNYTFDSRFETKPPPEYPAITNEYTWTGWRER